MFETIKKCFQNKEIRKKILLALLFLFIFRLGCYIPVPGLSRSEFSGTIEGNSFLSIMSAMTGGSLANATLFALGIGPYINASIIMQLLAVGIPALERLSKQGEEGRRKITKYTRYLGIILAVVQAVGIIVNFAMSSGAIDTALFGEAVFGETGAKWIAGIYMTVIYTAGAALVMWIGERITDLNVGNGMSLLIFVGLISTAGDTLINEFSKLGTSEWGSALWQILVFFALCVIIFFCITFVDLSERKVPVQYAKQVRGNKMYGGQSSVIPLKISGSGVMPLIFAFAIISFPQMIISLFWPGSDAETWYTQWLGSGSYVYIIVLCLLIFFFSFFYAKMQFDPAEIARNIQNNGGFIQGIRPGKPTSDYLAKISNRITLFGAIYLALIAFIPSMAFGWASSDLVSVFSTTGILIVVSVALEIDKQLQSQLMMKNYRGFLK